MAEKIPYGMTVAQYELKTQSNPVNLKLFYVMLHEWMIEKQYTNDKDPDFPEIMYGEWRHHEGREVWAKWRIKYAPQGNKFYRRVLNIDIHTIHSQQVEIVQDNKKFKLDKGELWFFCQAILEVDYENKWRNHPILKNFLTTFWKRFIWHDLEKHKEELYKDAYELHSLVKDYLQIRKEVQSLKSFWPAKGYKTDDLTESGSSKPMQISSPGSGGHH